MNTAGIRVPPPAIYLGGFLLGVVLEVGFPVAGPSLALAVVVAVAGVTVWLALDGSAMMLFGRARTAIAPMQPTTALVTSGPYRISRNPMYLGMAVLYLALAISLGVIWALAFLPLVLLIVDPWVIAREEPYLEAKFGQQYLEYKRRVRRWI